MSCFSLVTYSKLRPDKARKILTNSIFSAGIVRSGASNLTTVWVNLLRRFRLTAENSLVHTYHPTVLQHISDSSTTVFSAHLITCRP